MVIVVASFLTVADQPSVSPNTDAMTYTEWCQHMDQLSQNLRITMRNTWLRTSLDLAAGLVGVVLYFPIFNGVLEWPQVVGVFLTLAGAGDCFFYTMPLYGKAILEYQMWKEAGASHMWLYPCTAPTDNR